MQEDPRIDPALIRDAEFTRSMRGYDMRSVDELLAVLAEKIEGANLYMASVEGELTAVRAELAEQTSTRSVQERLQLGEMADDELVHLVGEETAHVLTTARQAAEEIRSKAEESAGRLIREATAEAKQLEEDSQRRSGELLAEAERVRETAESEAEAEAERLRSDARRNAEQLLADTADEVERNEAEVRELRAQAEAEVHDVLEKAQAEGRAMVAEAKELRGRMLDDLQRRRDLAREQITELLEGRRKILASFDHVDARLAEVRAELGEEIFPSPPELGVTNDEPDADLDAAADAIDADVATDAEAVAGSEADGSEADLPDSDQTDPDSPIVDDADPEGGALGSSDDDGGDVPTDEGGSADAVGFPSDESATDDAGDDTDEADETAGPAPDDAEPDAADAEPDTADAGPDTADATPPDVDEAPVAVDGPATVGDDSSTDPSTDAGDDRPADAEVTSPDPDGDDAAEAAAEERDADRADVGEAEAGDPVVDTDPEPPASGSASESVSESPSGDAAADAPVAETAPAAGGVDDLFDRIRSEREASVARAQEVLAAEPPQPDASPVSETDEVAPEHLAPAEVIEHRSAALEKLTTSLTRALKRKLADDQNTVLDAIRRTESTSVEELLPPADEHREAYSSVSLKYLTAAAEAGGSRTARDAAIDVADLSVALATALIDPLRRRIDRAAVEVDGNADDLDERLRALYREWKTQHIGTVSTDALLSAYATGQLASAAPGTPVRWLIDPAQGPCPDAQDNALAGAVSSGQAFPTGDLCPQAHPGCRCVLVPVPDPG